MSRLKALLRVSSPSTRNTQQTLLQACTVVAQPTHMTQQSAAFHRSGTSCNADDDWGYELSDLAEMDALINRLSDALGLSVNERAAKLQARRCMAPASVPGELEALRKIIRKIEVRLEIPF